MKTREIDDRTATEIRNELLAASRELMTLLREITKPVNEINCKLIAESDKFIKDAVTESLGAPRRKRNIVYKEKPVIETAPSLAPSEPLPKRTCSICRKPGHRATTCPEKTK